MADVEKLQLSRGKVLTQTRCIVGWQLAKIVLYNYLYSTCITSRQINKSSQNFSLYVAPCVQSWKSSLK